MELFGKVDGAINRSDRAFFWCSIFDLVWSVWSKVSDKTTTWSKVSDKTTDWNKVTGTPTVWSKV